MTTLSSFFCKIRITQDALALFFSAPPAAPQPVADWQRWWHSLELCDKPELNRELLTGYQLQDNQSVIDSWINNEKAFAFSDYDTAARLWHFGIILFSENAPDMIPMLAAIRNVAAGKEPDETDFIIVYDFLWGYTRRVPACLKFKDGDSYFREEANRQDLDYADDYLFRKWEAMENERE